MISHSHYMTPSPPPPAFQACRSTLSSPTLAKRQPRTMCFTPQATVQDASLHMWSISSRAPAKAGRKGGGAQAGGDQGGASATGNGERFFEQLEQVIAEKK